MREGRRVSVVMPAWNVAAYVGEAVASVAAQDWPAIELIAIDDGSDDGTAATIEGARGAFDRDGHELVLLRQANAGAAAARNAGVASATGDYIAFMDADDRWHPPLLTRLMATLDARPEVDLTFPLYRYVDAAGVPVGTESRADRDAYDLADLMIANPVHSATGVLVRRAALERAGPFDESLRANIDLDVWVRVAAGRPGNVAPTRAVLADYRRRDGQITGDWRRMERHWTLVTEKLARAGHALAPAAWSEGRARQCLYWATLAYQGGDHASARRLMAEAWRRAPRIMAADGHARIRTAACLASLMPRTLHDPVRRGFNDLRRRLGHDWS